MVSPDEPETRRVELGIGDLRVPVPSHLCLFYYDDDELAARMSFVARAFATPGEVAVLFGKRDRLDVVLDLLAERHGVNPKAEIGKGRLSLIEGERAGDELLRRIGDRLGALVERGAKLIRFLGFIGWGEEDWPNQTELLEFEARVNEAARGLPIIVMCTYNAAKLPGPILLLGGMATHPLTIVGTTLCENPHHVPPERFLKELEGYRSREWYQRVRIGPLADARADMEQRRLNVSERSHPR